MTFFGKTIIVMKTNSFIFFFILALSLLLPSCSSNDNDIIVSGDNPDFGFDKTSVNIDAEGGTFTLTLATGNMAWRISTGGADNIVTSVTPDNGKPLAGTSEVLTVVCSPSKTINVRTQTLIATNVTTGNTSVVTITQDGRDPNGPARYVDITVDTSVSHQYVHGFGGMCNPRIWTGSNVISQKDAQLMFAHEGLGYNILRLMIYPDERNWDDDVARALQAQSLGATIFACPWNYPDNLCKLAKGNDGKEYKKADNAHFNDYAELLVRYINHMTSKGVNLYAVSIQNEPDMDFTYWTPAQVAEFVRDYGQTIKSTGVKLMAPEACGMSEEYTNAIINNAKAYENTDILAGHLYQGFTDLTSGYVKGRHDYIAGLFEKTLKRNGKSWWMTEHLFNDDNKGTTDHYEWQHNLNHLGKEIHMCMEADCSAYVYWYARRNYGLISDNQAKPYYNEGEVTKNGYIMSHYAKYATGRIRVNASADDDNICVTSYIDETDASKISLVIINFSNDVTDITATLPSDFKTASSIITSGSNNQKALSVSVDSNKLHLIMEPMSIVSVKAE